MSLFRVKDDDYESSDNDSDDQYSEDEIFINRRSESDTQSSIVTFNEHKNYANIDDVTFGDEEIHFSD